jgi:hypothetical protein
MAHNEEEMTLERLPDLFHQRGFRITPEDYEVLKSLVKPLRDGTDEELLDELHAFVLP